jgi:hypothetical protein
LALLPAIDRGIFVITSLLSTVTENIAPVCNGTEVNDVGIVKFFGSQSSIKKPIVDANCGSTCGAIVVVSTGLGGGEGVPFLLHANNKMPNENTHVIIIVLNSVIIANVNFFNHSKNDGSKICWRPKNRPPTLLAILLAVLARVE